MTITIVGRVICGMRNTSVPGALLVSAKDENAIFATTTCDGTFTLEAPVLPLSIRVKAYGYPIVDMVVPSNLRRLFIRLSDDIPPGFYSGYMPGETSSLWSTDDRKKWAEFTCNGLMRTAASYKQLKEAPWVRYKADRSEKGCNLRTKTANFDISAQWAVGTNPALYYRFPGPGQMLEIMDFTSGNDSVLAFTKIS